MYQNLHWPNKSDAWSNNSCRIIREISVSLVELWHALTSNVVFSSWCNKDFNYRIKIRQLHVNHCQLEGPLMVVWWHYVWWLHFGKYVQQWKSTQSTCGEEGQLHGCVPPNIGPKDSGFRKCSVKDRRSVVGLRSVYLHYPWGKLK